MSEIVTSAGITGTALYLGRKVLGPTIDEFAKDLAKFYTTWRSANFERILEKVKRRAGDIPAGEGVHPRVARAVLDEGSWVDDDVQQEYLAGLLLTSRSKGGKDDSEAYYARIATNLTSPQTRLHYAIYSALAGRLPGSPGETPSDTGTPIGLQKGHTIAVTTTVQDAFEVALPGATGLFDLDRSTPQLVDAAIGLRREGLTEGHRIGGTDGEFTITPTSLGALLYMRARGLRAIAADFIHYADTPLQQFDPEPPVFQSARVGPF